MSDQFTVFIEYADGEIDEFEGGAIIDAHSVTVYADETTHYVNRAHTKAVHVHPLTEGI